MGNDIDGEAKNDQSGWSVSLSSDGTIVAIGAPYNRNLRGHVRIYQWDGTNWVQLGSDIDGEDVGDQSGWSVSLSADGTIVAIGAPENRSSRGHVRVYQWDGNNWIQMGSDIDGLGKSGYSVSINSTGRSLAVGAPFNSGNGGSRTFSGVVRVFNWDGSAWIQVGSDIDGERRSDNSGRSVSLSSDARTVVIGAPENDGNGDNSGHARVYYWDGRSWTLRGGDLDGENAGDRNGTSVSVNSDGTIVAVGAILSGGNGRNSGHARVYKWNGVNWLQQGGDIDGNSGDLSGSSLSLSSNGASIAIGAISGKGKVRIFYLTDGNWIQNGTDIVGENVDDRNGTSVSLSSAGTRVACGAWGNSGNGSYSGHTRVFQIPFPCPKLQISYLPSAYGDFNISTQGGSNGWIKTLVEGGTAPYTYSWTGSSNATGANPTGLKAGVYFLHVVDDNGCEGIGGPWNLREP